MTMTWDSATHTLIIMGTAFGGQDVGGSYAAGSTALWDSMFVYDDVYVCGTGLCSNSGLGTISSALGSDDLVAKAKTAGLIFSAYLPGLAFHKKSPSLWGFFSQNL